MPYTVEWANEEQSIILVTFEPGWTWQEFATTSAKEKIAMLDSVDHPVYIIQWFQGRIPVPKIGWTQSFRNAGTIDHPNYAMVILVTSNNIAQSLVNVFGAIVPSFKDKMRLVKTIEEAFEITNVLQQAELETAP